MFHDSNRCKVHLQLFLKEALIVVPLFFFQFVYILETKFKFLNCDIFKEVLLWQSNSSHREGFRYSGSGAIYVVRNGPPPRMTQVVFAFAKGQLWMSHLRLWNVRAASIDLNHQACAVGNELCKSDLSDIFKEVLL